MDPDEYFAASGRLIHEDDLAAIAASAGDKDGLLAAEFDDLNFPEDAASADFDAAFASSDGEDGAYA